jgi:hypothetical protein
MTRQTTLDQFQFPILSFTARPVSPTPVLRQLSMDGFVLKSSQSIEQTMSSFHQTYKTKDKIKDHHKACHPCSSMPNTMVDLTINANAIEPLEHDSSSNKHVIQSVTQACNKRKRKQPCHTEGDISIIQIGKHHFRTLS